MSPFALVIYRNPIEEWLWASGVLPFAILAFLLFVAFGVVWILIDDAIRKRRQKRGKK